MLLAREYLDEVKEHLRGEPAITFTEAERTLEDILSNDGDMEMLWVAYQKGVEDYSMEPDEAFRSAMRDELGITAYGPAAKILPNSPKRCPKCGWPTFHVDAHIVQTWEVNWDGEFVRVVEECAQVTHRLDDDDIWTCANCGHAATGREFNVATAGPQSK